MSEKDLISTLSSDVLNFYSGSSVFPYVPLLAIGPWIVTTKGGVIYETGSYGMLGFGHNPPFLKRTLCKSQVMANVKTASFSQYECCKKLRENIRAGNCPFSQFIFMNSGSEAVTVALRITDTEARKLTDEGGRYQGREIKFLSVEGSFHGRTARPGLASDSTLKSYQAMASFRDSNCLDTVPPNNIEALEEVFSEAEAKGIFYEALLLEPVLGEGRAGFAISAEFYDAARRLCSEHGTMLIVDSIQAGLRTHGALSILDYPGFENSEAPDMETYSKAINAGQYPLSVLALNDRAVAAYKIGTYGNTMTTAPRALDIASKTLDQQSEALQANIKEQGEYALTCMNNLKTKFPNHVKEILGTGLLFSLQLSDELVIEGYDGIETQIRRQGVNVIHSSGNRLRFTPWFNIMQSELDLVFNVVEDVIAANV